MGISINFHTPAATLTIIILVKLHSSSSFKQTNSVCIYLTINLHDLMPYINRMFMAGYRLK